MLYLLDKDVKTVKWNGIPLHEASSAIVKEEVNGDFTLTIRYPITDSGVYQIIKEDMLIKAPTPVLGPQLFRIKKPVENDNSLDITAYHVSDDIMQRSINPVSVVGQGCAMALSQMVQNAKTDLGTFSFTSDIMDSRTFNTTDAETLYSVLLDGKHSIVGTWEGELVRDNFALTIKRSRGADRGVVITTHKNLKSYQRTKNSQSVVTRIHAKSTFKAEGSDEETTITVTVDSPLISNYPYINEKDYDNNNAKTVDELRKWAEAKFKNEGIDKISDAIEIEAYELDGQVIHLGDTVNIKSRKHDVDLYKKAIAYEYNALTEEYISITFDDKPGVGGSGISSGISSAAEAILGVSQNAQDVAVERAVRNANAAFDAEFEKRVEEINDGIEQAQANAEVYADNIKQTILGQMSESDRQYQLAQQAQDQEIAAVLAKAQANTNLAITAQNLGNQAKSDAANALTKALQYKTEAVTEANKLIEIAKGNLTGQITNISSDLLATKESIKLLVTKATVDALTGRVASAEATLRVTSDALLTKVSRTDFDSATQRLVNAETSIQTIAGQIEQRLTRTQLEEALGSKDYVVSSTMSNLIEESTRGTRQLITQVESKIPTKIGARNLLRNGDFSQGIAYWESNSGNPDVTINSTTDLKNKVGRKGALWLSSNRVTPSGHGVYQRITAVQLTAGDKLTFSFDIAGHNNNASLLIIANGDNFDARTIIPSSKIPNITSDFTKTSLRRLQVTLDVRVDVTAFNFIVVFADGSFGNVVISNLMLETGPVASDFSYHESELVTSTQFHEITDRVDSHARTIGEQGNTISQIVQTANGIIARVDKISVGGTNLLHNTKDYSGDWSYNGNRRTLAPWQYKGLAALAVNHAWDGLSQLVEVKAGEVYTFSAYVASSSGNDTAYVFIVLHGNRSEPKATIDIPQKSYRIDGNFQRVSHTFQVLQDGYIAPRFERSDTSSTLYVAGLKLERGSIPTDYSPAPEDGDQAIQSVSTRVNQLAGSWAVQNLTNSGTVLNQLNLNRDGSVRIDGKLVQITGRTYIQDGVITSAKIAGLDAGKINTGELNAARIKANSIDGSKIVFDQAFLNKMTANEAYLQQLFAKSAFITQVQAVTLSASKISGGILTATNGAMQVNLNAGQIMYYTDQAALKRVLNGYPTQFVKFATGTVTGKGNAGVTVIGSNRWNTESSNDGGFVGIRAWNGANIDSLDLVGDDIRLASSAFDSPDGWDVRTLDSGLRIAPHNRAAERNSRIEVGDVWIMKGDGTYSSLRDILNSFNGNFSKGPNADSYTYYPKGF